MRNVTKRTWIVATALVAMCACTILTDTRGPHQLPSPRRSHSRSESVENGGWKFWPRSARVRPAVPYAFSTGHCGLEFLTDFDGSFWIPIDPNPERDPPEFFYSQDSGTMTLVAENEAEYRSDSAGETAMLKRHDGPLIVKGLCA
jgi:hypothetical protein